MSKITKLTGYQTSDGKIHPTAAEAEVHQSRLDFCAWYEEPDNQILGNTNGSRVELFHLVDWLNEHHAILLAFLLGHPLPEASADES